MFFPNCNTLIAHRLCAQCMTYLQQPQPVTATCGCARSTAHQQTPLSCVCLGLCFLAKTGWFRQRPWVAAVEGTLTAPQFFDKSIEILEKTALEESYILMRVSFLSSQRVNCSCVQLSTIVGGKYMCVILFQWISVVEYLIDIILCSNHNNCKRSAWTETWKVITIKSSTCCCSLF